MTSIKSELLKLFPDKDLGQVTHLLGMKVDFDHDNCRISLNQNSLIEKYQNIFVATGA